MSMLVLVFLLALAESQILKKVSHCMDACNYCPLYEPSKCLKSESLESCENGYSFQRTSRRCLLRPVFESNYVSQEFVEERKTSIEQTQMTSWKQGKVSECSFIDESGAQKHISVVGMFREIYSISKEFDTSDHHETFLFSFNLVRSSWMPHNDFLIVDMEAGNDLLGSYEITYDTRDGFQDYGYIACNGQQVMTQKFNIKINLNRFKTPTKIKITFTGFLFTSAWGITNVKFIPGCEKFTLFNKASGNCDFCDAGYFPVPVPNQSANSTHISRCTRCSVQCRTCINAANCTTCMRGFRLLANNTCAPNQDYVQVSLRTLINSVERACNIINESFFQSNQKQTIQTRNYTNPRNVPFGVIFVNFDFFYNTKLFLHSGVTQILVNNVKIDQIDPKANLTNLGYEGCSNDSLERWSVQKFSFVLSNIPSVFNLTLRLVTSNCSNCKFGVSNVNLFHVQMTSIEATKLQSIRVFSSEKEAVQQISISNQATTTIGGLTASAMAINQDEAEAFIPFTEDSSAVYSGSFQAEKPSETFLTINTQPPTLQTTTDSSNQQAPKQATTETIAQSTQTTKSSQTQTSQNSKQATTEAIAQRADIKSQKSFKNQKSPIDHMSFSRNGDNGIVIRLDTQHFEVPNGSAIIMELRSAVNQVNNQNQSVLFKSVASNGAVPLFVESSTDDRHQIFAFHTNKTYLNDVATLYSVNANLKTKIIEFNLERADFLDVHSQRVTSGFSHFFSVFAWLSLVLIFVAVLSGKVYLIEDSIQSLQMVFLTVYIYTSYLPASVVNTISGLRRLENFDIFATGHLENLQRLFLGDLVQEGPLKFSLFHKDINFIRGMIPLIFLLAIIALWFLIANIISAKLKRKSNSGEELISNNNVLNPDSASSSLPWVKRFHQMVLDSITSNKLDYWLQVFKLVFLPVIFLTFKQFNNFSYPENSSGSVFNMILCLLAFIGFVLSSIIFTLYCSRKYFKLEYETFIVSFPSIYYKKIPTSYLPTEAHRFVYPLIRYMKVFMFCLLTAILGDHTIVIFVVMSLIFAGELFYAWFHEVYQDSLHLKFLFVESLLMGVLLFVQMIISQISGKIQTGGYLAFGYVYMSIAIVIILNGLGRSGYLIMDYLGGQKSKEFKEDGPIGSERIV